EPAAKAIDAYRRAVSLYGGPLLEDDTTSDWHLPEQRRLREFYLQALEQLGELSLTIRDIPQAIQAGEAALATDGSRESVHRLLMRCYSGQHQHDLVSRQLQLCVTTLREELCVDPAPETLRLFHELTTTHQRPS